MEFLKDETKAAILKDEFAFKSIEAAIELLYVLGKDWSVINVEGKTVFKADHEPFGIAYQALCQLVGRTEEPQIDAKVDIGGGLMMPANMLTALQQSFMKQTGKFGPIGPDKE